MSLFASTFNFFYRCLPGIYSLRLNRPTNQTAEGYHVTKNFGQNFHWLTNHLITTAFCQYEAVLAVLMWKRTGLNVYRLTDIYISYFTRGSTAGLPAQTWTNGSRLNTIFDMQYIKRSSFSHWRHFLRSNVILPTFG